MTKYTIILQVLDMNQQDTGQRPQIPAEGVDKHDALLNARFYILRQIDAYAEQYQTIKIYDVQEVAGE